MVFRPLENKLVFIKVNTELFFLIFIQNVPVFFCPPSPKHRYFPLNSQLSLSILEQHPIPSAPLYNVLPLNLKFLAVAQPQALPPTCNLLTICILLSFFIFFIFISISSAPHPSKYFNFYSSFFYYSKIFHTPTIPSSTIFPCHRAKSWLQFEIPYLLYESDKNDSYFSGVESIKWVNIVKKIINFWKELCKDGYSYVIIVYGTQTDIKTLM